MIGGLLGVLIAIGILCIVAYAILQIAPIPAPVSTIIWAVVAIICLVLLANGVGIAVPGL